MLRADHPVSVYAAFAVPAGVSSGSLSLLPITTLLLTGGSLPLPTGTIDG